MNTPKPVPGTERVEELYPDEFTDYDYAKAAVKRAGELLAEAAQELTKAARLAETGTAGAMRDNVVATLAGARHALHNTRSDVDDAAYYLSK